VIEVGSLHKDTAQNQCHCKNEDIEALSNAKEYLKVQRRTILYIFVHLILIGYVSITSSERSNDGFTASISARPLIANARELAVYPDITRRYIQTQKRTTLRAGVRGRTTLNCWNLSNSLPWERVFWP